jgi:hypothetical protein
MQWQIGMKLFYISEALDKLLKTILKCGFFYFLYNYTSFTTHHHTVYDI